MTLWLYDDFSGWGRKLRTLATDRRLDARMFRDPAMVDGGTAFVRMHLDPKTRADDKYAAASLADRGIKFIPGIRAARLYDDKVAQARGLPRWMPETLIAETPDQAREAAEMLGFPLMSKAAEGSASHNVRFITTAAQLDREIAAAFGEGIPSQYRQVQRGYLLLQQFCAGNEYDFRVIAVGRERLILRRGNRDDRPMASGGDKEMAIRWPDAEASSVLDCANRFFAEEGFNFCGVDIVRDHDAGEWRIVEMTASWPTKNNAAHTTVSGRNWGEFFDIILDEIEAGALG